MNKLKELTFEESKIISGGTSAYGWGNWLGQAAGRIAGTAVAAAEEAYDWVKGVITY